MKAKRRPKAMPRLSQTTGQEMQPSRSAPGSVKVAMVDGPIPVQAADDLRMLQPAASPFEARAVPHIAKPPGKKKRAQGNSAGSKKAPRALATDVAPVQTPPANVETESAAVMDPPLRPNASAPIPPVVVTRQPAANAGSSKSTAAPSASATDGEKSAAQAEAAPASGLPDWDRLARNVGLLIEESGKAASAFLKPRETGENPAAMSNAASDVFKTLGQVAGHWLSDPSRLVQAQTALSTQFIDLWAESLRRFSGGAPPPPEPEKPVDKRFADPEWRANPIFDFLRQAYLITTDWATTMVDEADTLDAETKDKARFYLRQVSSALSPSNFLATNPELLRETFNQSGDNLVRGMRMLAEDIEAGQGEVKIRQSDSSPFKLGVNMAATPGKVVFRNDLMELIQYAPSTAEVYRRPLLIIPPWINKFYVLDLNPDKSFVRWAVEQGLTVFVVSWVNPDERHAGKGFEAYMRDGIFAALDAVERATGEREVSTIGYCVGGTLLAVTLAYMAAKGDDRITSSTFFTAQVDFRDAGDLKVFADEEQIQALEVQMAERGYLQGAKMANAFNMLRPNELIWPYVVNNYLKGNAPLPFDLLAWNSDSTRMPAANHAFYLRNCYLGNKLTKGEMEVGGETLDLGRVKIPVYNLATREDHIAPARSVFTGAKFFGGPMRYVLAGSGHIAGVVNPPAKAKYQYWAGPPAEGLFEDWLKRATEHRGTWWPDWIAWLTAQAPEKVPARVPGAGKLPALCDAPGDYVRVRA